MELINNIVDFVDGFISDNVPEFIRKRENGSAKLIDEANCYIICRINDRGERISQAQLMMIHELAKGMKISVSEEEGLFKIKIYK